MKTNIILTILILVLIAVIVLTSCSTPKHPVYHYHSGSTHIISDEPIGPYHISDPLTQSSHVFVEEFSDEEADDPYTYEPSTNCTHEGWYWIKGDLINCPQCKQVFEPKELEAVQKDCGHNWQGITLTTNPPSYKSTCTLCGLSIDYPPFLFEDVKKECDHDFGCDRPNTCLALHYCKKCGVCSWPLECDHLFVYQAVEVASGQIQMYIPERPCFCIKCYKQSTCY